MYPGTYKVTENKSASHFLFSTHHQQLIRNSYHIIRIINKHPVTIVIVVVGLAHWNDKNLIWETIMINMSTYKILPIVALMVLALRCFNTFWSIRLPPVQPGVIPGRHFKLSYYVTYEHIRIVSFA